MPANRTITDNTALTGATLAAGDLFEVVDVSDPTDAATGTNKKMTAAEKIAGLAAIGRLFTVASTLSTSLETVTVGGVSSALQVATDKAKVVGDLTVTVDCTVTGDVHAGNGVYAQYLNAAVNCTINGNFVSAADATFNGAVLVQAGLTVSNGNIVKLNLPTVDPGVPGQLWNNAGTVKVSP